MHLADLLEPSASTTERCALQSSWRWLLEPGPAKPRLAALGSGRPGSACRQIPEREEGQGGRVQRKVWGHRPQLYTSSSYTPSNVACAFQGLFCPGELNQRAYLFTCHLSIRPLLAHQAGADGAFCRHCPTSQASGSRLRTRSGPPKGFCRNQPRSLTS